MWVTPPGRRSKTFERRLQPGESVYSAEQILLTGSLTEEQVQRIASIRYNPLIQRAWIQSRADWEQDPLWTAASTCPGSSSHRAGKSDRSA